MRDRLADGPRLRALRITARIPQNKLATRVGVRPEHMNNVEAGREQPSDELMDKICAELGCRIDEVSTPKPAPEPQLQPTEAMSG